MINGLQAVSSWIECKAVAKLMSERFDSKQTIATLVPLHWVSWLPCILWVLLLPFRLSLSLLIRPEGDTRYCLEV